MQEPSIRGVVLDHIAHAVPEWDLAWPRYATELGAVWNSGGPGPGFAPGQLRFANRARVEILMPYDVGKNDFLARFLEHNGAGPHHLTFKVRDIEAAIGSARSLGFDPVGIDLRQPEWMEAFIHPRQATGVVVQLAQSSGEWTSPPPDGFPTIRRQRADGSTVAPASLRRVVHVVADLHPALELFVGLLGGEVEDHATAGSEEWIDLRWDGPLGVRLVAPAGPPGSARINEWLTGRTGRVHAIHLSADEPAGISDARPAPAGLLGLAGFPHHDRWVVEPEDNLGLRLVISAP